ncbi:MAG: ATPase AAA [Planctomycetota bacterium]|nr:MAG: ATPase AAA [Planctomycetota bacterium]
MVELFPVAEPEAGAPGARRTVPLAERMRPRTLEELVGQRHLLAEGALLRALLERGEIPSLILWGPPGCGKTTLARLLAGRGGMRFVQLSATASGVQQVRAVAAEAERRWRQERRGTLLFLDEIHRFSKAQQDALLPAVEAGTLVLVGATTENPSFTVIPPLRSRARVVVLEPLAPADLVVLCRRALQDRERGLGELGIQAAAPALERLAQIAGGDARVALTVLETAARVLAREPAGARRLEPELIERAALGRTVAYDRAGEAHFDAISALHKAVRGSDPDAALYWLARMLEGGEDPLYIARRLIRAASEDVGLADPQALVQAVAAAQAAERVGMPECALALAQACVYLAAAPKSDALERAYLEAQRQVRQRPAYPVPLHLRNAPTALMRELGYGEGYENPHRRPDGIGVQDYLPAELRGWRCYEPGGRGFEVRLRERLAECARVRAAARAAAGEASRAGQGEAPAGGSAREG